MDEYSIKIDFRRTHVFIALTLLLAAAVIYTIGDLFSLTTKAALILTVLCVFLSATLLLYSYLQGRPLYSEPVFISSRLRTIKSAKLRVADAERTLDLYEANRSSIALSEAGVMKKKIKSLFQELRFAWYSPNIDFDINDQLFDTDTGVQMIRNALEIVSNYIDEQVKTAQQVDLEENPNTERSHERTMLLGERAYNRLTKEIEQLSSRANVYIVVGTAVTIMGGIVLYYAVEDAYSLIHRSLAEAKLDTLLSPQSILSFVIRFSIVIFIEIFAFYFLRLHREAMDNIKYYQNEITNIDLKIVGLNAAFSANDNKDVGAAANELMRTERNFILKDKQTTIELEKRKHDKDALGEALDKLSKIFKQK